MTNWRTAVEKGEKIYDKRVSLSTLGNLGIDVGACPDVSDGQMVELPYTIRRSSDGPEFLISVHGEIFYVTHTFKLFTTLASIT